MPKTKTQHDLLNDFLDSLTSRIRIFIGLTDVITEDEFLWQDESVLSSTWNRWNPGEPNNEGEEDCVVLRLNGKWSAKDCSSEFAFVCQKCKSVGRGIL